MATVGEIRDAVVKKTRRLDQKSDILKDVLRTVRFLHGLEKFDKDLSYAELQPEYSEAGTGEFTMPMPADMKTPQLAIPVFGDFPHVANPPRDLKWISAENLFKLRREGRKSYDNSIFVFGDEFRGYCSGMPQRIDVSYWKRPVIEGEDYEDWLTKDWETVIFHFACAVNYGDNGYREKAQEHQLRGELEQRNLLASERIT